MTRPVFISLVGLLICVGCSSPEQTTPVSQATSAETLPDNLDLDQGDWVPVGPADPALFQWDSATQGTAWTVRNNDTGKVLYVGASPSGVQIIEPETGQTFTGGIGYDGGNWAPLWQDPDFKRAMSG